MKPLQIFQDLWDIVYPDLCLACDYPLKKYEKIICLKCQVELPKTDYMTFADNPVAKKFWGKVPVENAMALYHFHKSSKVQHLMHVLKYKGRQDVGIRLGNLLGFHLNKYPHYNCIDLISSVPMHFAKQAKRGYNQSDLICEGLSDAMNKPFRRNLLKKINQTESQTKKNRVERWKNVSEVFEVTDPNFIRGKHILLVDDVITTGATLEACALKLISVEQVKVCIAAVAHAEL